MICVFRVGSVQISKRNVEFNVMIRLSLRAC